MRLHGAAVLDESNILVGVHATRPDEAVMVARQENAIDADAKGRCTQCLASTMVESATRVSRVLRMR
ncbi:hypothetical protein GUJ93_ZPchr0004g38942 [Zizania palustris]|uniref:Uncharacterized protein n=1 Tax=Zizania palustris TaxID=103762 RepID=A0A8J5S9X4_ZIZPA|nr:hypothetical protein GUJ93_ZPchr0004g38645 [Zizania palustris]KAG8063964.1 hypothetical protein GUJ93_ZPchr0004g38942 [Zizania palustris]